MHQSFYGSHTVDSGYYAHAFITLSGKKYVLIKVFALNKQVSIML